MFGPPNQSRRCFLRQATFSAIAVFTATGTKLTGAEAVSRPAPAPAGNPDTGLEFIDHSFENASPLWYTIEDDGTVAIYLNYDHERSSPNRAAGHIHFQLQARAGTRLTLEFRNLENIYNGRPGSVARELKAVVVSTDGKQWQSVATEVTADGRVRLPVEMSGPRLFLARLQPYGIPDLERLLAFARRHSRTRIETVGQTVEGRSLEIMCLGNSRAPHRVFVRARAHPWESGGNWVVEGLVRRLLESDAEAKKYLQRYCLYVMPMANKDGVFRGRTRFNVNGKDLNRDWERPADPRWAPENHALEQWLERSIRSGRRPDFALELHNDGYGKLHLNATSLSESKTYRERLGKFEDLLRQHTWFSEGNTRSRSADSTLPGGWYNRYGVLGAVLELNCHWIARLGERPLGRHWEQFGAGLGRVFYDYFSQ